MVKTSLGEILKELGMERSDFIEKINNITDILNTIQIKETIPYIMAVVIDRTITYYSGNDDRAKKNLIAILQDCLRENSMSLKSGDEGRLVC